MYVCMKSSSWQFAFVFLLTSTLLSAQTSQPPAATKPLTAKPAIPAEIPPGAI